jgi:hypothetical protein
MSFRIWPGRTQSQTKVQTPEQRLDEVLTFLQGLTDKATISGRDSKKLFNLAAPVLRECENPEGLLQLIKDMVNPLQTGFSEYKSKPIDKLTAVLNGRRQLDAFKAQLKKPGSELPTDSMETAPEAGPVVLG